MRLTRMEAVRFGQLDDVPLAPLGEGLNLVVGPNGAGKTSFTTLARYVLYGFPTKRDAEPDFESSAGKRLGRLVFAEGNGEWAVERVEGVHGGPKDVHTLAGPARSDLVERVTQGVSRNEFRVVFGFGLQDMADIESGPGSDGVLSRLYAARVGLAVSPQSVRDQIDVQAAELYKPRGSTPQINALLRQIKEVKKRIRESEDAAAHYAGERERLSVMRAELESLKEVRDQTSARASELDAYARRLEALELHASQIETALRQQATEAQRVQAQLEAISVDEELNAAAPRITALLEDVSGYREWLRTLEASRSREREARRTAERALESAAIDAETAAAVVLGPETRSGIERFRDVLSRAQVRFESAQRALDDASARTAEGGAAGSSRAAGKLAPGLVTAGLGLVALVTGLVLTEWASTVVGALLVVAGAVLALTARLRADGAVPDSPVVADRTVELAKAESKAAAAALEAARSEWTQWVGSRGLQAAATTPEAAALLVSDIEEWRKAVGDAESMHAEVSATREACERFRDSLAASVGERLQGLETAELEDVPALAAHVRAILDTASEARTRSEGLADTLDQLAQSTEVAREELATALAEISEIRAKVDVHDVDSVQLKVLARAAADEAKVADEAYVARAEEAGRLEGELDVQGKDAEMADLRLELTGLSQRLEGAVESYAVLATASSLIARTQAFHERARQPEVVRRAGEVFSQITQGRYERIAIPTGGGEIDAFRGAEPTPSSRLSRGSQEQLYLALRIALVEQLDGVGEGLPVLMDDIFANFDPERHVGAAKAVAELARHRQVVFFTCHPEVADLFASVEPGLTRLVLERC